MIVLGALTPSRANSARVALISLNGQGLILQKLKVGSNPAVSARHLSNLLILLRYLLLIL
jgi:hypothetical protein